MTKVIEKDQIELLDLRESYFRVSNRIYEADLNIYEIGVYTVLCRFANNDTTMSYPSLVKIKDMLKISRTQVINTIKSLVEKNLIIKKKGNTGYSNRYYLKSLSSTRDVLVNDMYQGSTQDVPGVVHGMDTKKTNIKKTNKNTNKDKIDNNFDKETNSIFNIYESYRKELLHDSKNLTNEKKLEKLKLFSKPLSKEIEYSYRIKILTIHMLENDIKQHGGFFENSYFEMAKEAIQLYRDKKLTIPFKPIYNIKTKEWEALKDKDIDRLEYTRILSKKKLKEGDII